MRRMPRKPRCLKTLPRRSGRCRRRSRQGQGDRNLVSGRSADWAEEKDHPSLGQPWIKAIRTARPANPLGLFRRRDLPQTRQGRRSRHAMSNNLAVPETIAILPLPLKSPELNPVENIQSCVKTGYRTASSNPTRISSTTAATLGEHCKTDLERSCPSVSGNGLIGSDQ